MDRGSVFLGHPYKSLFILFSKYVLSIYTMVLIKRSAALLLVITNNKNNQNIPSWAQKEFMDCASMTFRGKLFQSLMVFGKNEHR